MPCADDVFSPERIAQKLSRAIAQGAALASMTSIVGCSDDHPGNTNLVPYALNGVGCWGASHDGGYYGQCCADAHCYTPSDGSSCRPADNVRDLLSEFPPGSGECNCNLAEDASTGVAGPFAPNSAHTPRTAGQCCYLVGSISCTGRPLMVDGQPLLAELSTRSDWAPFA
jgi:hypothetical protein